MATPTVDNYPDVVRSLRKRQPHPARLLFHGIPATRFGRHDLLRIMALMMEERESVRNELDEAQASHAGLMCAVAQWIGRMGRGHTHD